MRAMLHAARCIDSIGARADPASPSMPSLAEPSPRDAERPSGSGASGFGSTGFDALQPLPAPPAAATLFDVCHVGVVLRALLFVHVVVALGVSFAATGVQSWLLALAAGSAAALPGVLLWLLLTCALKHALTALAEPARWAAVMALGAGSGAAGAALAALGEPEVFGAARLVAPALAGATMAAAMFHWLRLRSQALPPVQAAARLAELQSRIRPHFLFNTLNTALTLVRLDPARAEGVLEDLAELFRVALSESGDAVTLHDEVELARRYLAIEQIRFGDRLKVEWDLDAAAAGARVPPLLLQPLVENAVRHGIEPSDSGGTIRVRTRVALGRAVILISNSVAPAASRPGNGMALANVRERLRLMHDVAAQFDTRRENGVFRVQILVPL
jgi:two-component system, LytTR family, sensor histidine kinase AlgZ